MASPAGLMGPETAYSSRPVRVLRHCCCVQSQRPVASIPSNVS